jgi:hypothetical protein
MVVPTKSLSPLQRQLLRRGVPPGADPSLVHDPKEGAAWEDMIVTAVVEYAAPWALGRLRDLVAARAGFAADSAPGGDDAKQWIEALRRQGFFSRAPWTPPDTSWSPETHVRFVLTQRMLDCLKEHHELNGRTAAFCVGRNEGQLSRYETSVVYYTAHGPSRVARLFFAGQGAILKASLLGAFPPKVGERPEDNGFYVSAQSAAVWITSALAFQFRSWFEELEVEPSAAVPLDDTVALLVCGALKRGCPDGYCGSEDVIADALQAIKVSRGALHLTPALLREDPSGPSLAVDLDNLVRMFRLAFSFAMHVVALPGDSVQDTVLQLYADLAGRKPSSEGAA